jgi:hypothetical protein
MRLSSNRTEGNVDMASQERALIGEEARNAIARLLLEKVRQDKYPSTTQMEIIEQMAPSYLLRDYLNVLLEKVMTDSSPSIPMLRRLARIAGQL